MAAGAAWLLLLLSARCMDFDTPSPPHSCDDGAHGELVSMMTGAVEHHSMVAIPTTIKGVRWRISPFVYKHRYIPR